MNFSSSSRTYFKNIFAEAPSSLNSSSGFCIFLEVAVLYTICYRAATRISMFSDTANSSYLGRSVLLLLLYMTLQSLTPCVQVVCAKITLELTEVIELPDGHVTDPDNSNVLDKSSTYCAFVSKSKPPLIYDSSNKTLFVLTFVPN